VKYLNLVISYYLPYIFAKKCKIVIKKIGRNFGGFKGKASFGKG